jgi:bacillolysin
MRVLERWSRFALALVIALAMAGAASAQIVPAGRVVTIGAATAADASDHIAAVRMWDRRINTMLEDGQLVSTRVETDPLIEGRQHERLAQYAGGVRVFGGELARQTDGGVTMSVFGTLYDGIAIDTTPKLTVAEAATALASLTGVTLNVERQPELVILPLDGGSYRLTYRARAMVGGDLRVYFLDATSGEVAFSYSDLETTIGTGTGVLGDTKKISTTERSGTYRAWDQMRPASIYTFDMKGQLARSLRFLNGESSLFEADLASDTDNVWTDVATVDGHVYAGWTYDYYYKRFGRSGLDGKNLQMITLVHPVNRADLLSYSTDIIGTFYLNAFYAGSGVMVYGEGLPAGYTSGGYQWNYFAGALDVVAHELTHGITDYTSGLIYYNESGALNEAFSDILGTSAEFFYQEAGTGYMKADYLIGEDLTTPMAGFRSMANPQAFGAPDHYSKRYTGTSDNGGVHTNSSIANHAFYLAIEGGTNRTSGITVQGVGSANRDKVEKVFFRAFTQMLTPSATFAMARAATIQAAIDLYGNGSTVQQAITAAWTACGVQ